MQHMTSPELIALPSASVPMAFISEWLVRKKVSQGFFLKVWVDQNWGLHITLFQHWGSLNFNHQKQSPDHGHSLFPAWLDSQWSTDIWGAEVGGEEHVCPLPGNDSGLTFGYLKILFPFLHTGIPYKWPFWTPLLPL